MSDQRQADRRDEDDRRQADRRSEDDRREANRSSEDGYQLPHREVRAQWHLDKKVPIGIIIAGIITVATMVANNRDTENKLTTHDKALAVIEAQRLDSRMSTLESQMIDMRSSLQRIEAKLDRAIESKQDRR